MKICFRQLTDHEDPRLIRALIVAIGQQRRLMSELDVRDLRERLLHYQDSAGRYVLAKHRATLVGVVSWRLHINATTAYVSIDDLCVLDAAPGLAEQLIQIAESCAMPNPQEYDAVTYGLTVRDRDPITGWAFQHGYIAELPVVRAMAGSGYTLLRKYSIRSPLPAGL